MSSRPLLLLCLVPGLLLTGCRQDDTLVVPALTPECSGPPSARLRVAAYNIKSGMETSIKDIGDVIEKIYPDVIALEEVDNGQKRTGEVDQATVIAERLGYQRVYAATLSRGVGTYGIALLTKLPIKSVSRIELDAQWNAEPRVAIDAVLCRGSTEVRVLATHTDVWTPVPNIEEIARHLASPVTTPTIVMGDLNVRPDEPGTQPLVDHGMVDLVGKFHEGPTFWSAGKRLDYIFVDNTLRAHATSADIGTTHASDHLPVWADFEFPIETPATP